MYVSFNFYLLQNTMEYKKRNKKKKEDLRNTVYFSTSVKINKNLHNTLRWLGRWLANVPSPPCGSAAGVETDVSAKTDRVPVPPLPPPHAIIYPIGTRWLSRSRGTLLQAVEARGHADDEHVHWRGDDQQVAQAKQEVRQAAVGPALFGERQVVDDDRQRDAHGRQANGADERDELLQVRYGSGQDVCGAAWCVVKRKNERRVSLRATLDPGTGKWNACPPGILKTFLKSTGSIHFAVRRQQTVFFDWKGGKELSESFRATFYWKYGVSEGRWWVRTRGWWLNESRVQLIQFKRLII